LLVRDAAANRTPRDWLEEACDIPQYMDPFSMNADVSQIIPRQDVMDEDYSDNSEIRIFVFMKEKPEVDEELIIHDMRPPWDISTNVKLPPKYLRNGRVNPDRFRPASAGACHHYKGSETVRPFSAPCGYPEFSNWKHPLDMQPYLTKPMVNLRRYSSVSELKRQEANPLVRAKGEKLLPHRKTMRA